MHPVLPDTADVARLDVFLCISGRSPHTFFAPCGNMYVYIYMYLVCIRQAGLAVALDVGINARANKFGRV